MSGFVGDLSPQQTDALKKVTINTIISKICVKIAENIVHTLSQLKYLNLSYVLTQVSRAQLIKFQAILKCWHNLQ